MKNKLFLLLMLIINVLNAKNINHVLNHSGLIDQRAYEKINTIGLEVKTKLDTLIFLDIKGNNGIDISLPMKDRFKLMKETESNIVNSIKKITNKNFVVLSIVFDQKHANILFSNEKLKNIIDKNDILDSYVIPLLAAKDKNILKSKVSAASLNGFAQIADVLAENKNIELHSSIGSQGKTASTIWRVFMYTLVVIGIIAYAFIILREKKLKKKND